VWLKQQQQQLQQQILNFVLSSLQYTTIASLNKRNWETPINSSTMHQRSVMYLPACLDNIGNISEQINELNKLPADIANLIMTLI